MNEINEINENLQWTRQDINLMQCDIIRMQKHLETTTKHIKIALSAEQYLINELRVARLVRYCQTGKFSNSLFGTILISFKDF